MPKKFYAVHKGNHPGVYKTWAECQAEIRGFKGQDFKGFDSEVEATAYCMWGTKGLGMLNQVTDDMVKNAMTPGKGTLANTMPDMSMPTSNQSMDDLFSGKELPAIEVQEFTIPPDRPVKLPENLIIYTDGSCYNANAIKESKGKPGAIRASGGYCAVFLDESMNELMRLTGGEQETTNNRMELTAIKEALQYCNDGAKHNIKIISDSKYAIESSTTWLKGWKRNAKKSFDEVTLIKSDGSKADNQDLIKEIDQLLQQNSVSFTWTKGHAQNKYNEMCDVLAKTESERQEGIKGYRESLKAQAKEQAKPEPAKEATKVQRVERPDRAKGQSR